MEMTIEGGLYHSMSILSYKFMYLGDFLKLETKLWNWV